MLLGETESLCPVCLRRVAARRVAEDDDVYLEKDCPEHGPHRALIWRGARLYLDWARHGRAVAATHHKLTTSVQGCPYDCGLCPEHKGDTCTAVIEVTARCNLNCPICFASAFSSSPHPSAAPAPPTPDPSLDKLRDMLHALLDSSGPCPVQLSGGEPTLRDDLPEVVSLAQELGFGHIQVNTNGVRIAGDASYLKRLADSGTSVIYLQCDGVSDDVYRHTRGAALAEIKTRALANCAEAKMGVILVPTLVPGVNDHQIGDIVRLAKEWMPTVKGIHFQPVSYFGRFPHPPQDHDRLTIPDLLQAIELETGGEIKRENFAPRTRQESHCAFAGLFVLMEDGKLLPITHFDPTTPPSGQGAKESPAEHTRRFIEHKWRFAEQKGSGCSCQPGSWLELFDRARAYSLSISGMPFQDAGNIDLERLKTCCVHVVAPWQRLVPLCAYYLTSVDGRRLYSSELRAAVHPG